MSKEIRILADDDYDLADDLPPEPDVDAIRAEAKQVGREYKGKFAGH